MFVCKNNKNNNLILDQLELKLEQYYSNLASVAYYDAAQDSNEEWGPNSPHQVLLRLIKDGDSVLDMGCGTGVVAQHVQGRKIKYTGIDWSSTAINTSVEKFGQERNENVEAKFIQGSIYKTGFKDESFDIVSSLFVIEHLTRPERFLEEAMRLVRVGGVLFILCPNYRRFGRMPSLPLGGNNSLKEKISQFQLLPSITHLVMALYWKIKVKFIGPWAIWTEPACFDGIWRPDADAVYLASREEMAEKINKGGFVDRTNYWLSQTNSKLNRIDCLIVAQKCN